ncbi:hypothetical protein CRM22_009828 [Opisthorchis felineus]|uniref:Hcy-binding domain-containing protein n=1 Tax=Opisthorchis felineus TaxID=147828 RepID=A0A4S2L576_OPIFE|nr:hypothetical protein CRM22_009828 [Opisthorchis felineus]
MTDDRVVRWLNEIRVLDGGVGSECQKRSHLPIDGHKAWSCRLLKEDPNLVCEVHKSYLRAGCDVLSTNTYQASPLTLAKALKISDSEAKELMRHAVRLVRRAIATTNEDSFAADTHQWKSRKLPVLVAGSLGPYGACLADGSEYSGSYADGMTFDELVEFHYARAKILVDAGVDFLAWETIPILMEVAAIAEVMRRLPNALAWLSVASSNGQTTVGGDPLHQVALEIQKCDQIFGIGVNCCIEHDKIGLALSNLNVGQDGCGPGTDDGYHPPPCSKRPDHLDKLSTKPRKLLVLYANSGEMWLPPPKGLSRKRGHWVWPPNKGPSVWARTIVQFSMRRCVDWEKELLNGMAVRRSDPEAVYPKAQWVGGCCRVGPTEIRHLAILMKPDEVQNVFLETTLANPSIQTPASTVLFRRQSARNKRKLPENYQRRIQPLRAVKTRRSVGCSQEKH